MRDGRSPAGGCIAGAAGGMNAGATGELGMIGRGGDSGTVGGGVISDAAADIDKPAGAARGAGGVPVMGLMVISP